MDDPRLELTITYGTRTTSFTHLVVNVGELLLHLERMYPLIAKVG